METMETQETAKHNYMTNKEEQIVRLLQEGKSYSHIQSLLKVSPSKIALIKKMHFAKNRDPDQGSSATASTTENATTITTDSPENDENGSETIKKPVINLQNQRKMERTYPFEDDDSDEDYPGKYAIEKLKLQHAHEIEMRRLEKEEEELELRRYELRIKEKQVNVEKNRREQKGKVLLFRIRKLAEKCQDGEWSYDDAIDVYNQAVSLQEAAEEYCVENNIEIDGLTILRVLDRIIEEFDEITEDLDEGESTDISFDRDIPALIRQSRDADWNTYE